MVIAPASTSWNAPREEEAGILEFSIFVEFVLPVFSLDHRVFVTQSVCDRTGRRRPTVVNKVTAVWYCAQSE